MVFIIGWVVLAGWAFDLPILRSFGANLEPMRAITALAFVFSGTALWLLQEGRRESPRYRIPAVLAALFLIVVAVLTLAEYSFGWDPGLDGWLFAELSRQVSLEYPGRMAANTALEFLAVGLAFLFLDAAPRRKVWPGEFLGFIAGTFSILALLGYVYGVTGFFAPVAGPIKMALSTAVAFVIVSVGILCARPQRGMIGVVASAGEGGVMARRLLAAAILLPLVSDLLLSVGQWAGWYEATAATAIQTVVVSGALGGLVLITARSLNGMGAQRQRAEEEIKQLNRELSLRLAELEVSNAELEAFSYAVSHDLRAPLRNIDGLSRILLENSAGQLEPEDQDNLRRVRAASQRMDVLIDDLLRLARVTSGELRRTKVDLTTLARTIASEVQRAEPERVAEFHIAPNLQAEADPNLLRVALENLLSNAWKFTGKKRDARIEFGCATPGECRVAGVEQGEPDTRHPSPVIYFVRDNGAGFDMAYACKLFGPFQRLHAQSEFPGTGVGLATVRRIIHRHGGRIWAESEIDRGACFYFSLPT